MTVAELIEQLKQMPEYMTVTAWHHSMTEDEEGCWGTVTAVPVTEVRYSNYHGSHTVLIDTL